MLYKLMQVMTEYEKITEQLCSVVDELFMLLCQHCNLEEFEGLEPLFDSMKDVAERKAKNESV